MNISNENCISTNENCIKLKENCINIVKISAKVQKNLDYRKKYYINSVNFKILLKKLEELFKKVTCICSQKQKRSRSKCANRKQPIL